MSFARTAAGIAVRIVCGAAVFTAAACDENTINQRIECSIEGEIFSVQCLPHEYADELDREACIYDCELAQELVHPDDPFTDLDCTEVSYENVTDEWPTECEVVVDWEEEILEDPDSDFQHRYSCNAPWNSGEHVCPSDVNNNGVVEEGEALVLVRTQFYGCAIDSTSGHQSCIDSCREFLEQANADLLADGVTDCEFPVNECDALSFAVELEGQVCDASELMVDRTGDRADKIVWSTVDGNEVNRPLACSLSSNCCEEFSRGVCNNLNFGSRASSAAEQTSFMTGSLTYADSADATPVVVPVSAMLRSSSRPCENSAGTCPFYLEDLQLSFPSYLEEVTIDGIEYELSDVSVALEAPTLGVLHQPSREVKLLGDRTALRVMATARVPSAKLSIRVDEIPELPAAIDARISPNGDIVELTVTHTQSQRGAVLSIALNQDTGLTRGDK